MSGIAGRERARSCQRGATTAEYTGMIVFVAAIVLALVQMTPSVPGAIAGGIKDAICSLTGESCGSGSSGGGASEDELAARGASLAPFVSQYGGRLEDLAGEAEGARLQGDYAEADRLYDELELYRTLIGGGRGEVVAELGRPSEAEFDQLVADGTIDSADDRTNRRYFRVAPSPGDGVIVHDFFIRQDKSLFLKGDDRGPVDPLLGDLELTQSRVMLVIDRESGRGVITQAETCTITTFGRSFCNEPRPITFDLGDNWENDPDNDATGEGINIDETNQFEITADEDTISLSYDALNSITPKAFSVDGTITLQRQADGTYRIDEDTRDDYPAQNIYHYRPGQPPDQIEYDEGEDWPGAIPRVPTCDLPDLPDLPFGPDLPNLPAVPGPC